MYDEPVIDIVTPGVNPEGIIAVKALLTEAGLGYEADIELFVAARDPQDLRVVACMGLAGDVVKCAAVHPDYRGYNLAARMVEQITYEALDRGRPHLFMFTKPQYRETFEACGFHLLAHVDPLAILMENTPHGITRYAERLAAIRSGATEVAAVVLNANPFTAGHQHLVQTAALNHEQVEVFVVGEDASMFKYVDRLQMVIDGCNTLPQKDRIRVHEGSRYIVSRATFPSYFLRDKADLARAATGLDLQLFRRWIAPALGIRHRYIGTEPFSKITDLYNADMHYWLEQAPMEQPPVAVHTVERIGADDLTRVISATEVRRLILEDSIDRIAALVPPTTLKMIKEKYVRHR